VGNKIDPVPLFVVMVAVGRFEYPDPPLVMNILEISPIVEIVPSSKIILLPELGLV
jgi:hypothetical protein